MRGPPDAEANDADVLKATGCRSGACSSDLMPKRKAGRPIVYIGEFGAQEALDEADGRRMKRCDTVHE